MKERMIRILACVAIVFALCIIYLSLQKQKTLLANIHEMEKKETEIEATLTKQKEEMTAIENELRAQENLTEQLVEIKKSYFATAQSLEEAVKNGTATYKIAYLTFDDGPYDLTPSFLDVLDQYDVQATFFYLGKTRDAYNPTYQRIKASGHTIANHTYSHNLKKGGIYSNVDTFLADVVKNREFIENKLGITTNILRFPGGSPTAGSKKNDIVEGLRKLGYGYVDWNSATGDGGGPILSPEEYRDNVLNDTAGKDIIVVLMHDYSQNTVKALPGIIEGLQAQGYLFLPLFYESVMVNK